MSEIYCPTCNNVLGGTGNVKQLVEENSKLKLILMRLEYELNNNKYVPRTLADVHRQIDKQLNAVDFTERYT